MDELTYRKELLDHLADSWNDAPTIDAAAVVPCRWVYNAATGTYSCPKCRKNVGVVRENFCPKCGADLREVDA